MQLTPETLTRWPSLAEAACLVCDMPFSALDVCTFIDGFPEHPTYPQLSVVANALIEAIESRELDARFESEDGISYPLEAWRISREALIDWLLLTHPDIQPEVLLFPVDDKTVSAQEVEKLKRQLAQSSQRIAELETEVLTLRAAARRSAEQGNDADDILSSVQHSFLTKSEVMQRTKLARSTLDEYVRTGRFPKPVSKIGRRPKWLESEVQSWMSKS